jgi:transcriptional regulator with XRE-family HTH domain
MSDADTDKPLGGKRISDFDRAIAQRLRMARTLIGMSQEHLAAGLGITFQQVQKYEKGSNRVSAGRLKEISKIVGRPVSWFYEEEEGEAFDPSVPVLDAADLRIARKVAKLPSDRRRAIESLIESVMPENL